MTKKQKPNLFKKIPADLTKKNKPSRKKLNLSAEFLAGLAAGFVIVMAGIFFYFKFFTPTQEIPPTNEGYHPIVECRWHYQDVQKDCLNECGTNEDCKEKCYTDYSKNHNNCKNDWSKCLKDCRKDDQLPQCANDCDDFWKYY